MKRCVSSCGALVSVLALTLAVTFQAQAQTTRPTSVPEHNWDKHLPWKPRDSHHVFLFPLAFFFGRPPGAVVALCATTHEL